MHEFLKAFEAEKDIEIELFYLGSLRNIFEVGRNILRLYKTSDQYDIIHCQYGSFCALVCMFLSAKKIVTLRGSDLFKLSEGTIREKLHSSRAVFFTRLALRRYNRIIVMSKQMKRMLPHKYQAKTDVITDPVNLEKFAGQDKSYSRKTYFPDYGPADKLILFTSINSYNPVKRFDLASAAVKRANEIDDQSGYKLVAANNYSNDEMKYVFSAVDICLLTSTHEGWPNCIKESLACDVPFVSTPVSDLKDIAIQTKNCFVCDDNADQIAEKIVLSLKLPSEDLRKRIEFLSVDNIKNELMKVYRAI